MYSVNEWPAAIGPSVNASRPLSRLVSLTGDGSIVLIAIPFAHPESKMSTACRMSRVAATVNTALHRSPPRNAEGAVTERDPYGNTTRRVELVWPKRFDTPSRHTTTITPSTHRRIQIPDR